MTRKHGGPKQPQSQSSQAPSQPAAAPSATAASQHRGGRQCQLCKCFVAGGPDNWQRHTEGIKHRRNALGGTSGRSLSVFEDIDRLLTPDSATGPSRARSKDPIVQALQASQPQTPAERTHRRFGSGSAALRQGRQEPTPSAQQLQQSCEELQAALTRELVHFTGRQSRQLRRVTEVFSPSALKAAFSTLPQRLQSDAKGSGQYVELSAAELACLAWTCQQRWDWTYVKLAVPLRPADASDNIAFFTSLCLLVDRLRGVTGWLEGLSLRVGCTEQQWSDMQHHYTHHPHGAQAREQGWPLWTRVLRGLEHLAQARVELQFIKLSAPSGVLPPAPLTDLAVALTSTTLTLRHACRLAVVMGTHPRVGAQSLLRHLPGPVLELILDSAIPKRPCQLKLRLVHTPGAASIPGMPSLDGEQSDSSYDKGSSDSLDSESENSDNSESGGSESDEESEGGAGGQEGAAAMGPAADVLAVAQWLS